MSNNTSLHIIGGGLAGSEAAFTAARAGLHVVLHEMRPLGKTPVHKSDDLAELVCSNSFRSDDASANAVGLLHAEMRQAGSLIMGAADKARVPAGSALAVDRELFARIVTEEIANHPNITLKRGEVADLPPPEWGEVIIATGPLTSPSLSQAILDLSGETALSFFDAIAPILYRESIDMDVAWYQSRYDKSDPAGTGKDYINCPLDKAQYEAFIDALLDGEKTQFRDFEDVAYFDGCLPIEVMAERGRETLRHGPMKPRGLTNAHAPHIKPYAVVQLRQDNKLGTLYNMVGFQTKLKYAEQVRIFRTIPGLEQAEFARLGGLHRNLYLNSPQLLDEQLRLKKAPQLRFAGQMTGCEGYVESAAIGHLAARFAIAERRGRPIAPPPITTAFGALLYHITGGHISADNAPTEEGTEGGGKQRSFQPMNVNFGLFPPIEAVSSEGKRLRGKEKTIAKRQLLTARALHDWRQWLEAIEK